MTATRRDDATGAATVAEAAARLGLSAGAVRKRIERGQLQADKGPGGQWRVWLPESLAAKDSDGGRLDANQPLFAANSPVPIRDTTPRHDATGMPDLGPPVGRGDAALVEQLRSEVAHLRDTLARSQAGEAELRRLLAAEHEPKRLAAPTENPPPDGRDFDPPPGVAGVPAVPGPARRPWWRRWGGQER